MTERRCDDLFMKKIYITTFLAVFIFISPNIVLADYIAVGKFEATVCEGFILESCSQHVIYAVGDDKNKLFSMNKRYSSVSEFHQGIGLCHIRLAGGLLSNVINAAALPTFWERKNGNLKKLDAESISFKCRKIK